MTQGKVLSFDVGIKNLAYCLYDQDSNEINKWKCVNIGGASLDETSVNLFRCLDDIYLDDNCSKLTILIENQPVLKAPTMKSIQMMIYSYFKILDVHGHCETSIYLVSATKKNKYMIEKGFPVKPKDYKSNKENSIKCVEHWVSEHQRSWQMTLAEYKKKDDICDALLQILVHLAL